MILFFTVLELQIYSRKTQLPSLYNLVRTDLPIQKSEKVRRDKLKH